MSERSARRSQWGEDDQKGAMNLVTPDVTLEALKSVREGRIIDLSHELKVGHPWMPIAQSPFYMSLTVSADDLRRHGREMGIENDAGVFTERVELCMHSSTHIDALGHFTIGEEMFNGWNYKTSYTSKGLERLGMEQMPPMITRCVLLDVGRLDGGDFLEKGRVVTRKELKAALDRAKVEIRPGDCVAIRTGWGRFFMADNARYLAGEPGIDEEAAAFLTEQGCCAIGADTMGVEVLPHPNPRLLFPVHQHTLVEMGVHLIENLALDTIAKEAEKTGVASFCFVLLPVKVTGATGCPVRPVALL